MRKTKNNNLLRSKTTGRFIPRSSSRTTTSNNNIVNGRLYLFKPNGIVVRSRRTCSNGLRLVSYHKNLNGFARVVDLAPASREQVREYLANA